MHTFIIFAVIACIFSHVRGKPLRVLGGQNRDTGEAEYENNDEREANDYAQDDQEALMDGQGGRVNGQRDILQVNRALELNSYKHGASNSQPVGLPRLDNFSELSGSSRDVRNDKTPNTYVDSNMRPILRYRQTDAYADNNEQEPTQHLSDNTFKINREPSSGYDNSINKRAMLPLSANEEGDLLFENHKEQENKLDKSEYARENADDNMQSRYSKQLYNVPLGSRDFPEYKKYEKLRININRDRRQVQKGNSKVMNEQILSPQENENEESAIKRHIKKLSESELEELFNSLSEDKRSLLKKIIENDYDQDSDGKNKREITKKAGAVEENNYIENGQLDSSKNQGVSSNVEDVNTESSMSHETTENKRTMSTAEIGDVVPSKNTGGCEKTENKAELVNQNDVKETKPESNLDLDTKKSDTEVDLVSNSQTVPKTDNKRSANVSELANILKTSDETKASDSNLNPKECKGSENTQEIFSNDGELAETVNDETEQHSPYKNNLKREAYADSLKSLEESFPNSNAYDESNSCLESDAPLIRVKRRNAESAMVKRAANVMADSNVPYFPNKGENDDEDNEEGSEFDDDGFYDRTSNYAKNNVNNLFDPNSPKSSDSILKQRFYDGNSKCDTDTMSLGSDTDNVMTGVEGVNENLMYSSGSRTRRASEKFENIKKSSEDTVNDVTNERRIRSTPLQDNEAGTASENYMNIPGYQENDAFGPLPRNYEGDLGRYKRIRRVKQTPVLQENAS